jgi:Family of unknown function (DUF5681)
METSGDEKQLGGVTGKGFLPGVSGNPGGRPKGRSLTAILREQLDREVGGKQVAEAFVGLALQRALKGDFRYWKEIKNMSRSGDEPSPPDEPDALEPTTPPCEDPDETRRLELHRLDLMAAGLWDRASRGDGAAVAQMLKIMALRAKLLGIEAPSAPESPGPVLGKYEAQLEAIYGAPQEPDQLPDASADAGADGDGE